MQLAQITLRAIPAAAFKAYLALMLLPALHFLIAPCTVLVGAHPGAARLGRPGEPLPAEAGPFLAADLPIAILVGLVKCSCLLSPPPSLSEAST